MSSLGQRGVDIGYTVVKQLMRQRRRRDAEVFVPLHFTPGDVAEVDFFEAAVYVDEPGDAKVIEDLHERGSTDGPRYRVKAFLFLMRLPCSGVDVVVLYPKQNQVCFLDGHVRAFNVLGGVPTRIVCDNLKAAVLKHLVGSERLLQPRFLALATHHRFEPCFARPRTGHDKGAVEARGKGFRQQRLTPIPRGRSLLDVTVALQEQLIDEHRDNVDVAAELASLAPRPERPFDPRAHRVAAVSARSLLQVDGATYSVPESFARATVDVFAGAFAIDVAHRGQQVCLPRAPFGEKRVRYLHYAKALSEKPQAVRQCAPRLLAELGEPFTSTWTTLVDKHDELHAARIFCRVLRLVHEHGVLEAAKRVRQEEAGKGFGLLGARAPPLTPVATLTVPKALDVAVQSSPLDIYDQITGAAP
jgi:transposase